MGEKMNALEPHHIKQAAMLIDEIGEALKDEIKALELEIKTIGMENWRRPRITLEFKGDLSSFSFCIKPKDLENLYNIISKIKTVAQRHVAVIQHIDLENLDYGRVGLVIDLAPPIPDPLTH
jgi:hypothetical protein